MAAIDRLKGFENGRFERRELPAERLQVDAETRTAKIEIESGEVLRFDLDSGEGSVTHAPGSDFKIKFLRRRRVAEAPDLVE